MAGRLAKSSSPFRATPRRLATVDCSKIYWYTICQTMEAPMQCPVCEARARNLTPNTLDGVVVGCDQCGDYRISGAAFYEFTMLKPDRRVAALATAKLASRAGWPLINSRCIQI